MSWSLARASIVEPRKTCWEVGAQEGSASETEHALSQLWFSQASTSPEEPREARLPLGTVVQGLRRQDSLVSLLWAVDFLPGSPAKLGGFFSEE